MKKISYPWWFNHFGENEKKFLLDSFNNKNFTYGEVCQTFELEFARLIGTKYAVITNSGTSALAMSLIANNIGKGDEVILPSISWIATAQAVQMTGAKVIFVDVEAEKPIINLNCLEKLITSRTKAIIPVHYNGRLVDTNKLKKIINNKKIVIIEDCCKSMFSQNYSLSKSNYAGTKGNVGCYSFGMVSLISSIYGGICVTNDKTLYEKLKIIRWHGVEGSKTRNGWNENYKFMSMNFKPSDLLTSISSIQLKEFEERKKYLINLYKKYKKLIDDVNNPKIKLIEVDIENGETPLLIDIISSESHKLRKYLEKNNIYTCRFHPPMHLAKYLLNQRKDHNFINSYNFGKNAFHLPSGVFRKDLNRAYFQKLKKLLVNF